MLYDANFADNCAIYGLLSALETTIYSFSGKICICSCSTLFVDKWSYE